MRIQSTPTYRRTRENPGSCAPSLARVRLAFVLLGKVPRGIHLAESARCTRLVSAVIQRQGRYLITQRSDPGILAGVWEFPTGLVAIGESHEAALQREIIERLGVEVSVAGLRARRTHFYVGYSLERVLYDAQILPDQEPRPLRVADFRWVTAQDLESYPFPPADQATLDSILGHQDQPPVSIALRPSTAPPTNNALRARRLGFRRTKWNQP